MALLHFSQPQANVNRMQTRRCGPKKNGRRSPNKSVGWLRSVWQVLKVYGQHSTVHGLDRLFGDKQSKWERLIWLLAVICALCGTVYVCMLLSRRFNEGKFETVVDTTRLPVYRIPFPVVTICNLNRLNWERIDEAKQRFLPNEKSSKKLQLFEKIIGAYDNVRFSNLSVFSVLQNDSIEELNNVNFSSVFDFMTWRCEEFLTLCYWRRTKMDCCEIFSKRRSRNALCWAFNSLETVEGRRMQLVDPLWPWRTGSAGPKSALNVRVLINPDKHFPNSTNKKGLSVMITEPNAWHAEPYLVPSDTETFLEVEPVMYFYSNDTRYIPSNQRECVFDDETTSSDFKSLQGYIYMMENCESECHQEYLVRYCNCTLDLLFPPGQHRYCKPIDLKCLAANSERFMYHHNRGEQRLVRKLYEAMLCKCYRNCRSLYYLIDIRPSFLAPDIRKNVSYVDLDVHFRFETLMVYRTSLVFDWMDLMVAFGGIAGLFLGCSLISGVELLYYILVDVPNFIFEKLKSRQRRKTNQIHDDDKNHVFIHRDHGNRPGAAMHDNSIQLERFFTESNKHNQLKTTEKPGQLITWDRFAVSKDYKSNY